MPLNAATASIVLSGTWSATVQFETSLDNITYVSIGSPSSATTNGMYTFALSGQKYIRARASAFSSGPIGVAMAVSVNSSNGAGGSGCVPGAASAGEVITSDGSGGCTPNAGVTVSGSNLLVANTVLNPNGGIDCKDATGSTTAYTCPTPTPATIAGYTTGMLVVFVPQTTNTSTGPTINVAGLGVKNIKAAAGTAVAIGALVGGTPYSLEYDGTQFVQAGGGASGGATIPSVTNLIKGNGAGNGADTKVAITSPATAATIAFVGDNETVTLPSGTLIASGGALGTPSSGTGTNITAIPAVNILSGALVSGMAATTQSQADNSTKLATTAYVDTLGATKSPTVSPTSGTSVSLTSAIPQMFVCTSTCTVTVPAPAANAQYCIYNDDNVSTVITLSAIGSSARYENTARTAYGTAGTGTMVSSGQVGDKACLVFRDSTHYSTLAFQGTWTVN